MGAYDMFDRNTLYVSDLDGTLLNQNAELSVYTKKALNRMISEGMIYTIATGRTIDAVKKIMADVELNMPVISFNGSIIYDVRSNNNIKTYWLTSDTVNEIIRILKSNNISSLMYQFKDETLISYYESLEQKYMHDFVEDRRRRFNTIFRQADNFNNVSPEYIINFTLGDTYERIKPVYDALTAISGINMAMYNYSYGKKYWGLEVFSGEASKRNAVKLLREVYGYKRIISFGDNHGDLMWFEAGDIRVAVNNASNDVKAEADAICETCDNDGVVKWIDGPDIIPIMN